MSDTSQGPGWWQASDGKWYPPDQAPAGPTPGMGQVIPPTGVDIGGSISYGWGKFTTNAGPLIVAVLFIWVVNLVLGLIAFPFDSFVMRTVLQIVGIVVGAVVSFGLVNMALKIVKGQPVEIGDAFPKGPLVVPYAITGIIVSFVVSVGLVLCIIPGIIAATFLLFAHFTVLDEGLQPGDALSRSVALVKGNVGPVLGFIVVAFLINLVGACACGVGLLVTIPLTVVAGAKVYMGLKGQPVAA